MHTTKRKAAKLPDIRDLSMNCDAIDATARRYSFESENWGPGRAEGGGWEVVRPTFGSATAKECLAFLKDEGIDPPEAPGIETLREACDEQAQESENFEPMMSFAWPLPGATADGDLARKLSLHGSCMVLVTIDDDVCLALTGGGMDLSWQIAQSYIACGYWPPATLDLPDMAEDFDANKARIAACVLESYDIARRWAESRKAKLLALVERATA